MIKEFQGQFRWLSNFAGCTVVLDGQEYRSVEHAYMSAKCDDKSWKEACADPRRTAGQIKRMSRNIQLKPGWDQEKLVVMRRLLEQKFYQEPYHSLLLATGTELIQEGNLWGDKFWGVDLKTGKGFNHLGKMIMEIRSEIQKEKKS